MKEENKKETNMVPFDKEKNEEIRKSGLGDLSVFEDEFIFEIIKALEIKDVLNLSATSKLVYLFCNEDHLWKKFCIKKRGPNFLYKKNWKNTTFYNHEKNEEIPTIDPPFYIPGIKKYKK